MQGWQLLHCLSAQIHFLYTGAAGTYSLGPYSSSSRALLSAEPKAASESALGSAHLFGTSQLLASLPFVNKLISPACNLIGQQAEPACMQQVKCAHCFEKSIADIGLHVAGITTVSAQLFADQCSFLLWCQCRNTLYCQVLFCCRLFYVCCAQCILLADILELF